MTFFSPINPQISIDHACALQITSHSTKPEGHEKAPVSSNSCFRVGCYGDYRLEDSHLELSTILHHKSTSMEDNTCMREMGKETTTIFLKESQDLHRKEENLSSKIVF
jgi:hypothetical protein